MADSFPIRHLRPSELTAHPRNFRRHPDRQVKALADSIGQHGWLAAPIFNERTGRLLDGHARVEIAAASDEPIPVRVIDVSEAEELRILVSFDRIGELRERDDSMLVDLLRSLGETEEGLPPGWDDADLTDLLAGLEPKSGLLPDADPDAIPEYVETRCKLGELWALGGNRLLVGDCTDAATVECLFGGKQFRMVWTDPPYGVAYADKNEFLNSMDKGNRNQTPIENDHLSEQMTEQLVQAALTLACAHGKVGASCYVACPPGTLLPHFIAAVAASGFQFKHSLAWVKNQFVLGRCDYHYRHEVILYGWKEGAHFFRDDHSRSSVFEVDKPRSSEQHPTMKPVDLVRQMVENSSRPSEIVYDPFLGSGTTVLACEMLGRVCYGCEIAPEYASVVLARWEQATGKEAERIDG